MRNKKDTLTTYLEERDMTMEELTEIVAKYLAQREDNRLTLYKYLKKKSCAAWIRFDFKINGQEYHCISVEDFIKTYGTISENLLHQYIVVKEQTSGFSQSQGSVYWLTLERLV